MARRTAGDRPRHERADPGRRHWLRTLLAVTLVLAGAAVATVAIYRSVRPSTSAQPGTPSSSASGPAQNTAPQPTPSPSASQARALWQQSIAPATALLTAQPSLRTAALEPTSAGLSKVLTPLLADHALAGDGVALVIQDAVTGNVLFDHGGSDAVLPASTAKLAVAVAALEVLGPDHQFSTRVVAGPGGGQVILVGGGDPTLAGPNAVGPFGPGYPSPARLADLASQTASALRSSGGGAGVRVGYDASLFAGSATGIGWKPTYITEGDVAPVSALEVDEGRPDLRRPARSSNPAASAAAQFAALLTADGVTVTGAPAPARAAVGGAVLASVSSPSVAALVQRMLGRSDNDLAEALARQVAIARGEPATFAGGALAVRAALTALGVDPKGFAMVDSSGLSPSDRARPAALVQLVALAVGPAHPELSSVLAGLPVAAFSGTLGDRFKGSAATAAGAVRAKTGTLDGVVSLAGYVEDAAGRTLAFAVVANGVALNATTSTENAVDRLTAGIAGCGCA
jgi:D-alanyl-D-alanine carboxypeptidase/D-alanyl-D-alanine-endopeptidase (penicillin-binding protein 4)